MARVTEELSRLRGAAMKMGQLVSMDTGDFLPPELSAIMAKLREDAQPMPPQQLKRVLERAWGKGWLARFARFDVRPLAAASIGQVHRAWTLEGQALAVKVQYPGVRESIDSDVDNVATLMRLSGLVPAGLAVAPLLAEAKRQLHEEADYGREGGHLKRFGDLLAGVPGFVVPGLVPGLSTADVLAMDRLVGLVLRELFEFRLMQTDPNFANYRYDEAGDRLVLLDFGATREIPAALAQGYRALLKAGMAGDREGARLAAISLGLFDAAATPEQQGRVIDMFETAMRPMRTGAPMAFDGAELTAGLKEEGLKIATDRDFWHVPPADILFVQRKLGGLFLLGARLKARVDVGRLLARWL
jgi:predicted unusual protein kinase regulating ubiquinone biosynthesis (AarF/ABC1/UbiB family)